MGCLSPTAELCTTCFAIGTGLGVSTEQSENSSYSNCSGQATLKGDGIMTHLLCILHPQPRAVGTFEVFHWARSPSICSTAQKLVCDHSKQQSEKEKGPAPPTLGTPFLKPAILQEPRGCGIVVLFPSRLGPLAEVDLVTEGFLIPSSQCRGWRFLEARWREG